MNKILECQKCGYAFKNSDIQKLDHSFKCPKCRYLNEIDDQTKSQFWPFVFFFLFFIILSAVGYFFWNESQKQGYTATYESKPQQQDALDALVAEWKQHGIEVEADHLKQAWCHAGGKSAGLPEDRIRAMKGAYPMESGGGNPLEIYLSAWTHISETGSAISLRWKKELDGLQELLASIPPARQLEWLNALRTNVLRNNYPVECRPPSMYCPDATGALLTRCDVLAIQKASDLLGVDNNKFSKELSEFAAVRLCFASLQKELSLAKVVRECIQEHDGLRDWQTSTELGSYSVRTDKYISLLNQLHALPTPLDHVQPQISTE